MNNSIKIILLFLPLSAQCMKRDNREALDRLYADAAYGYAPLKNPRSYLEHCMRRDIRNFEVQLQEEFQWEKTDGYSVFTAVAIQKIPLKEKQELIHKIKFEHISPKVTPKDQKFAITELCERRKPIVYKVLLMHNAYPFRNNLPKDILNVISLIMLETEKPLF